MEEEFVSALPAMSTDLLAVRTVQSVKIGSAAIKELVAWCFTEILLFGHRVSDCRVGLMLADHEANFLRGHTMVRHEDSGPVGRCVSGFISIVAGTADAIRIQETSSCCMGKPGSQSPHLANAFSFAAARGMHCSTKNDL